MVEQNIKFNAIINVHYFKTVTAKNKSLCSGH